MPQKLNRGRQVGNLLLAAHLSIYALVWFIAVSSVMTTFRLIYSPSLTQNIAIALFWLPVLALHLLLYVRARRSGEHVLPDVERQAYREGFADAMERLADRSYDVSRLALDDEGELVEIEGKRKRREF